jgi:hypothetical protein
MSPDMWKHRYHEGMQVGYRLISLRDAPRKAHVQCAPRHATCICLPISNFFTCVNITPHMWSYIHAIKIQWQMASMAPFSHMPHIPTYFRLKSVRTMTTKAPFGCWPRTTLSIKSVSLLQVVDHATICPGKTPPAMVESWP